jgi:glutathione synthase
MRLLFIMDPPERLHPAGDTTLAFIEEAERRGHTCVRVLMSALRLEGGGVLAGDEPLARFDAVLHRKDPPFDNEYYFSTLLLERARGHTLLVNDPRGLRDANEKLYIFHFEDVIAPTVVERHVLRLRRFFEAHGEIVVKPLDGNGGRGVFHIRHPDRNANALFEMMTGEGRLWVMAQRYLPAAREGDQRILLVDGEVIGAVLRVPREDETRGNLHVGGTAVATTLTDADRRICARIAPRLRADGLYFVGIDVIGGLLTEVNVTSPTGVREVERLTGERPQARFLDWLERAAAERPRRGADRPPA